MYINEQHIHKVYKKMNSKKYDKKWTEALRIDFNEDDTKKFRKIQQLLGIQNKSDVIRFCLNFTYLNYPRNLLISEEGSS